MWWGKGRGALVKQRVMYYIENDPICTFLPTLAEPIALQVEANIVSCLHCPSPSDSHLGVRHRVLAGVYCWVRHVMYRQTSTRPCDGAH